jgi:hypothetical protein
VSHGLPWRRPRYELALLALVAVAALTPVHDVDAQDVTRLCLTGALEHGRLSADECLAWARDKSQYNGHLYTDKAPGLSALALPSAELLRLDPEHLGGARLWGVRVLSSGLAFLVCAFLLGRVAEGLAPGCGGATLVAFALGTLAAPFAAASFGHIAAATLGFGAFALAWNRQSLLAGLAAGAGVLVEYQAAGVVLALGVYVALRGLGSLARYAAGIVPGAALLLAYDTVAFGAPWHLSYRYIANGFVFAQNEALFGVGVPKAHSSYEVFSGAGGMLVVSPVLVAAGWGLVLLARTHRREALVCAAVTLFFLAVNCGYFLPYGGISPGPRFLIPALPFLCLGLPGAFRRHPRLTALLAALSVAATLALTLVWSTNPHFERTVWWELARVPVHGADSPLVRSLTGNVLTWLGIGRILAAGIGAIAAAAALVLAYRPLPQGAPWSRRSTAVVVASLAAIAVADASALAARPYRHHVVTVPSLLYTTLTASTTVAVPGDEVDFVAAVENPEPSDAGDATLELGLPPGLRLLGPPAVERGPGCTGSSRLTCDLEFVPARQTTAVRFGVRVLPSAADREIVTARATSGGIGPHAARVTVRTGSS